MQSALIGAAAFAGGLIGGLLPALLSNTLGWPLATPAPYRVPLALAALIAVVLVRSTWPSPLALLSRWCASRIFPVPVTLWL